MTDTIRSRTVPAIIALLTMGSVVTVAGAQDESAQGRFWYELKMDEDTYSMDIEIVDGIVVPDELQGGERVKVMLVGAPLDQAAFLAEFADAGNVLIAAMRLKIEERVEFDVCSYEPDRRFAVSISTVPGSPAATPASVPTITSPSRSVSKGTG